MKQCVLLLILLLLNSVGCGPDTRVQTNYKFTRIGVEGVQHEGDTLYIFAKANAKIVADLSFSAGSDTWVPIENKQKLKSRKLKGTDKAPEYGINIVLRLPPITTDKLRFKISATFPDGTKVDKIVEIKEIIDSIVPKSKVTFDPFSL